MTARGFRAPQQANRFQRPGKPLLLSTRPADGSRRATSPNLQPRMRDRPLRVVQLPAQRHLGRIPCRPEAPLAARGSLPRASATGAPSDLAAVRVQSTGAWCTRRLQRHPAPNGATRRSTSPSNAAGSRVRSSRPPRPSPVLAVARSAMRPAGRRSCRRCPTSPPPYARVLCGASVLRNPPAP